MPYIYERARLVPRVQVSAVVHQARGVVCRVDVVVVVDDSVVQRGPTLRFGTAQDIAKQHREASWQFW